MSRPRPPIRNVLNKLGLEPDAWQLQVIECGHRRLLLNCSRQAGKSTVVAVLSLLEALIEPGALILLLSRSQRQSSELFRRVVDFFGRLQAPYLKRKTSQELELTTHSRIVSLPCQPDTIRGFAGVHMLVIDEAARVPDELYRTVRPMLAASNGRLLCLSTPCGQRGFFYQAWAHGGPDWTRIEVPAEQVPRIAPEFLAEERRCLGETWYRQEYCCSFEALEGLVYPDFARCVVAASDAGAPGGRAVGGIDFGFRNPFAAVWGTLDRDGILWLTGEHYCRQQPLSHHAAQLPRVVRWYADPAGAGDISDLRCAGFAIGKGNNAVRAGIAAVSARLASGTLRVVAPPRQRRSRSGNTGQFRYVWEFCSLKESFTNSEMKPPITGGDQQQPQEPKPATQVALDAKAGGDPTADPRSHGVIGSKGSEHLEPTRGGPFLIAFQDDIHGKGAAECPGYPTTRAELLILARHYSKVIGAINLDWFAIDCVSSRDLRISSYANRRLDRIAQIVGDEAIREVHDKAFAEYCRRHGRAIWDAIKSGDSEARTRARQNLQNSVTCLRKKHAAQGIQEEMFACLREQPSSYRFDAAGDLWSFVWSQDGQRLVLHVTLINGSGTLFPDFSIAPPENWSPPFGING